MEILSLNWDFLRYLLKRKSKGFLFLFLFFYIHYIILRIILRMQPLGYGAIVLYI